MKSIVKAFQQAAEWLDHEDPGEPAYDPVHLGTVLIVNLAAVGIVYWLLWTLLVYEGGLPLKIQALLSGDKRPGAFEGWLGNLAALALTLAAAFSLKSLYRDAARKAAKR